MEPDAKRRKVYRPPPRRIVSSGEKKDMVVSTSINRSMVIGAQTGDIHPRIEQAKNYAVAQAQQDGCTGNFKIFDSPFWNFLVPVVPTRAELDG